MNVLSLFDGMSCGQVALERAGIKYDNYYASEIDKYAIQIANKNYPNTIQLGDIRDWRKWNLPHIDILIGGSPCQGFSIAGAGLNFDDPRSKLFFDYVDILRHYKPEWFLLENVKMKKEWQDIISGFMVCKPIEINSALVSAQNRKRLYWTNIPNIEQPEDRHIYLKDIIEDGDVDRERPYTIGASYFGGSNPQLNGMVQVGLADDINGFDIVKRVYSSVGKSPTLTNMQGGHRQPKIALDDIHYRKLTPLECERLQTLLDNYTQGVSNTQRYKMLGNGWTVEVIAHIFRNIK